MRCPFCAEDVRDDAAVCRYCRNYLTIPEALLAERAELQNRLAALRQELMELNDQIATAGNRTVPRIETGQRPRRE